VFIKPHIAKYVQKVVHFKGHLISIDFYFPSNKIRLISIYNYQRHEWQSGQHSHSKGLNLFNKLSTLIVEAERQNFHVITMGDFNSDPNDYFQALANGHAIPAHLKSIQFLDNKDYVDQPTLDNSSKPYATFYNGAGFLTSRIDLIWFPSDLIIHDFCFSQTWFLPSFINSLIGSIDHCCVINYFAKSLLIHDCPLHKIKQSNTWCRIFNYKAMNNKKWDEFSEFSKETLNSRRSELLPSPKDNLDDA
jgi:hypothetical protein